MPGQITKELTIGQLAERSGCATSALRFYEDQGLISSSRTSGNQRRYTRDTLRRVAFIRVSQNLGMPLAVIREALAQLPENRTPNRDDWAKVSESWHADLEARIWQLTRLRDNLSECIGCGCLSLEGCMLINPNDVCGEEGSGPRVLLGGPAEYRARENACRTPPGRGSFRASPGQPANPDRC